MQTLDLSGGWRFRADRIPRGLRTGAAGLHRWMPAIVPGTVHTDLMAQGKIPDPFHRTNELDVQWVDSPGWIYRRRFHLPASFLEADSLRLVAEGLDTFASVHLNGRTLGETANMFVAHVFDVKPALRVGRNTIEIRFDSPVLRAGALEREHGCLQVTSEPHRVYARKAQYSFGWDWGPRLTTSGIWRPIRLEAYSTGRLVDPFVRVQTVEGTEARISLQVGVERYSSANLRVRVRIPGHGAGVERTAALEGTSVSLDLVLSDPHIWWPNGYGDQPMYEAEITLLSGDRCVHTLTVPFAVRTVRLLQETDDEGRSFVLEVNGVRIFCKGADWIPADSFLPRVTSGKYERLLAMARDASMNMIRVWGGGIYEADVFYSTCDRLGLMVWQDFMYACGEYPDYPSFLEAARSEAEQVVRRLRNHPSIVLWCGNNECEWIYCTANPGKEPDDMRGAAIFRDVLPAVVRELDGSRPFWRSTPFGEGFPNSQTHGNHHQWEVWSKWMDFKEYGRNRARFVSEFGFQAPAEAPTLESVLLPEDRTPQSAAMEHHNKQVEGTERLYRFQASHYGVATGWKEFLFRSQLVQAEALKCAVEHWRRRKFATAGSLIWQLNDCWPVSSWSLIDSDLRPKAAYYYACRFFAPLLVSLVGSAEGVEVWMTNDFLHEIRGRLHVTLLSFRGKVSWKRLWRVRIPANDSCRVALVPNRAVDAVVPGGTYVLAELFDGDRCVAENRHFFREPKHLNLIPPDIRLSVKQKGPSVYHVTLRSPVLALATRLTSTIDHIGFHENVFDLDPGRPRTVTVSSLLPPGRTSRAIRVTSYTP